MAAAGAEEGEAGQQQQDAGAGPGSEIAMEGDEDLAGSEDGEDGQEEEEDAYMAPGNR